MELYFIVLLIILNCQIYLVTASTPPTHGSHVRYLLQKANGKQKTVGNIHEIANSENRNGATPLRSMLEPLTSQNNAFLSDITIENGFLKINRNDQNNNQHALNINQNDKGFKDGFYNQKSNQEIKHNNRGIFERNNNQFNDRNSAFHRDPYTNFNRNDNLNRFNGNANNNRNYPKDRSYTRANENNNYNLNRNNNYNLNRNTNYNLNNNNNHNLNNNHNVNANNYMSNGHSNGHNRPTSPSNQPVNINNRIQNDNSRNTNTPLHREGTNFVKPRQSHFNSGASNNYDNERENPNDFRENTNTYDDPRVNLNNYHNDRSNINNYDNTNVNSNNVRSSENSNKQYNVSRKNFKNNNNPVNRNINPVKSKNKNSKNSNLNDQFSNNVKNKSAKPTSSNTPNLKNTQTDTRPRPLPFGSRLVPKKSNYYPNPQVSQNSANKTSFESKYQNPKTSLQVETMQAEASFKQKSKGGANTSINKKNTNSPQTERTSPTLSKPSYNHESVTRLLDKKKSVSNNGAILQPSKHASKYNSHKSKFGLGSSTSRKKKTGGLLAPVRPPTTTVDKTGSTERRESTDFTDIYSSGDSSYNPDSSSVSIQDISTTDQKSRREFYKPPWPKGIGRPLGSFFSSAASSAVLPGRRKKYYESSPLFSSHNASQNITAMTKNIPDTTQEHTVVQINQSIHHIQGRYLNDTPIKDQQTSATNSKSGNLIIISKKNHKNINSAPKKPIFNQEKMTPRRESKREDRSIADRLKNTQWCLILAFFMQYAITTALYNCNYQ